MENLKSKIKIIVCLLLSNFVNQIHAQFSPPTYTDYAFGVSPTQSKNTGNDILEYNGDIYRVFVWEPNGSAGGIGWQVNSTTGYTTLTPTCPVLDPDVCLVQSGETIYAVAVYYDNCNGEWDIEIFDWNGSAFNSVSFLSFDFGSFGSTVNIDGNDHPDGQFAVVWDHSNGDIYSFASDIPNFPVINTVQVAAGQFPDVSLYYNESDDVVHIAYIDLNTPGNLIVDDHDYFVLATGSSAPSNVLSVGPPSHVFYYPRIASPNANSSSSAEWTVVVEDNNSSLEYYIVGFNNGNITPIPYNNGTYLAAINDGPNYYPSVTYDNNYPSNGIWVGWQFDDFIGNYSTFSNPGIVLSSAYSVVLKCDNSGVPLGIGLNPPTYWQVPNGIVSGDISGFLSLSGRYANDELFLTYLDFVLNGLNVDDIYIKNAPSISGAVEMRFSNNDNQNQSSNTLSGFYKGSTDELFHITLYDLSGKALLDYSGTRTEIGSFLKTSESNIPSSLYLVRIISVGSNKYFTGKISIGK